MHRCSRVWLAASSVMVFAGSAWAVETHAYPECSLHPSDNDVTAAKGAFQAGTVSFNEADYQRAILYWEDAYRRDCTATLLLHHLGRAYEGAGNLEQAVIALRTYTERAPDSPERAQILRRIEVFEQKIAADKQQAANASAQVQPTQPNGAVPPGQPQNGPATVASTSSETQNKPFPWVPVAVTAASGVTAIVGGLVYLSARSDINTVESKCPNRDCRDNANLAQQGNDARTRASVGTGVFIGGLAIAGAGAVWLYLDSRKSPTTAEYRKPPALSPWVGAGTAGLAWQGEF
jgi:hypothetical protein